LLFTPDMLLLALLPAVMAAVLFVATLSLGAERQPVVREHRANAAG